MRTFLDAINDVPHPEERPEDASRRTRYASAPGASASLRFVHSLPNVQFLFVAAPLTARAGKRVRPISADCSLHALWGAPAGGSPGRALS
jgi:hypothetical protein